MTDLDTDLGALPRIFGTRPDAFARGGDGLAVRYGAYASPLGTLLVAATERGICAATLGDARGVLAGILRADLPTATLTRDDDALADRAAPVLRALGRAPEADAALLALALDVGGTAFQRTVWAAIRAIPCGQTRTYGELAIALGKPTATRAVAAACGANPVAVVVPCHRVVGGDGALRGYRWGRERKARLLAMEARHTAPTLFD